jgi:hypothetical protein
LTDAECVKERDEEEQMKMKMEGKKKKMLTCQFEEMRAQLLDLLQLIDLLLEWGSWTAKP